MEKIIEVFKKYDEVEKIFTDNHTVETAAKIIKCYCQKHDNCDGCIFFVSNVLPSSCKLMKLDCGDVCGPCEWEI